MVHLLKLEWLKQKDYILFKLLAGAYLLFLPMISFGGKKLDTGPNAPFNPKIDFFQFPSIWGWLGYIGSWMVFFILGFMAVLMVTNEYSNKTLRQNIIVGLKREDFFKSKVLFMAVMALAATAYYAICAIVIGLLHVNDTLYLSTVFKNADMIPRFWLMTMGYMSFGMLVGLLIKRTGIALFVYLAYSLVFEAFVLRLIHYFVFKNFTMNFYPLNAMEDLAPVPVAEFANNFLKESGIRMLLTPWEAATATIIYTSLFLYWSYKRLKTSDL